MRKFLKKIMKNVLTYIVLLVMVGVTFGAFVRTSRSSYDVIAKRILFTTDGTASGSNVLDVNDGGDIVAYGPLVDGSGNNFLTGVNGIETDPIWNSESGNYLLLSQSGDYYASNPEGFLTGGQIAGAETDPVWSLVSGDYILLANSGDYYPSTNPDGYITGYSETDPNFESNSGDYYTLNPLGFITGGQVSGDYIPLSFPGDITVSGNNHILTMNDVKGFNVGQTNQSIGNYSSSFGSNNISSGIASVSMGVNSEAIGPYSLVMANSGTANGQSSFAFGSNVIANGVISLVFGSDSIVNGIGSIMFGDENDQVGDYTFTHGVYNSTKGDYSTAIGYSNYSSGLGAVSIGYDNNSLGNLGGGVAIGYKNDAGLLNGVMVNSVLIGKNNRAHNVEFSVLGLGYNNSIESGNYLLSLGFHNNSKMSNIIGSRNDVGTGTTTTGENFIIGSHNSIGSLGDDAYNYVFGLYNTSKGISNSVIGERNVTDTTYSNIIGYTNTVNSSLNNVIGYNNTVLGGNGSTIGVANIIGSGAGNFIYGGSNDVIGTSASNIILGINNTIEGPYSSSNGILGSNNTIDGDSSFSIGSYNNIIQQYSFNMGVFLTGASQFGVNLGKRNKGLTNTSLEVGLGTDPAGKNGLTVYREGGVQVSDSTLTCNSSYYGTIQFSGDNFYGCKTSGWVLLN